MEDNIFDTHRTLLPRKGGGSWGNPNNEFVEIGFLNFLHPVNDNKKLGKDVLFCFVMFFGKKNTNLLYNLYLDILSKDFIKEKYYKTLHELSSNLNRSNKIC